MISISSKFLLEKLKKIKKDVQVIFFIEKKSLAKIKKKRGFRVWIRCPYVEQLLVSSRDANKSIV